MDERYKGMTVNERLYVGGVLVQFDEALAKRDAEAVRELLKRVGLTDESIGPILEQYGLK